MSEYPGKRDIYHLLSVSDDKPPTHRIIIITNRDVSMNGKHETASLCENCENKKSTIELITVSDVVFLPENIRIFSQVPPG